jgi:hypothetical protein
MCLPEQGVENVGEVLVVAQKSSLFVPPDLPAKKHVFW